MVLTCIEDVHEQYKKSVPRVFREFVDTGSWTGFTYAANERVFQKVHFKQRVGVNVCHRKLTSSFLNQFISMPVALAPIGMAGIQWGGGEILAAQAAEQFGVPFCLSTMSTCSIEELDSNLVFPFCFQLYVMKDRKFTEKLIERAHATKCDTLIVTMDLQLLGQRNRDIKNGLFDPRKLIAKNLWDFAKHPRWALSMLKTSRRSFGNIVGHASGVRSLSDVYSWAHRQYDSSLTWKDIEWIRRLWGNKKLVIKGIMDPDDAVIADDVGADALIVSNHGGRQLDGTISSLEGLEGIRNRMGNGTEIWMDGGIRSGQDVLKALAFGANGVFIGRPWVYGLGADGRSGVYRVLEIIRKELDITMGFCGLTQIRNASRDILIERNKL